METKRRRLQVLVNNQDNIFSLCISDEGYLHKEEVKFAAVSSNCVTTCNTLYLGVVYKGDIENY